MFVIRERFYAHPVYVTVIKYGFVHLSSTFPYTRLLYGVLGKYVVVVLQFFRQKKTFLSKENAKIAQNALYLTFLLLHVSRFQNLDLDTFLRWFIPAVFEV
jgi:hypothetical protein